GQRNLSEEFVLGDANLCAGGVELAEEVVIGQLRQAAQTVKKVEPRNRLRIDVCLIAEAEDQVAPLGFEQIDGDIALFDVVGGLADRLRGDVDRVENVGVVKLLLGLL